MVLPLDVRNPLPYSKRMRTFQRRIENFACEECGAAVVGDGYTDHCPHCLWSKHVDVFPGDRAATCDAMMEPMAVEGTSERYRIVHRCVGCGYTHRVDARAQDSIDALVALATKRAVQ